MNTITPTTTLENSVIYGIAINDYNSCNGGKPSTTHETLTYTWTLSDGCAAEKPGFPIPSGRKLSGVISSLVQKGLVIADTEGPKDDRGIQLTEAGLVVFESIYA